MSFATWCVVFIHPDERFRVPAELFATTKTLLNRLGYEGYSSVEEDSVVGFFDPRDVDLPFARQEPHSERTTPFSYVVRWFKEPTPEQDLTGQRYCGHCKELVRTWATCERCGVEEDPTLWKLGPPVTRYTRTFEVGYYFEGGPYLAAEPEPVIDQTLREHLGPVISEIERSLGTKLVMKQYVGE